jgi:hypothetical protein
MKRHSNNAQATAQYHFEFLAVQVRFIAVGAYRGPTAARYGRAV